MITDACSYKDGHMGGLNFALSVVSKNDNLTLAGIANTVWLQTFRPYMCETVSTHTHT